MVKHKLTIENIVHTIKWIIAQVVKSVYIISIRDFKFNSSSLNITCIEKKILCMDIKPFL